MTNLLQAFSAAFVSYFLVKFVPKWGIALIATSVVFFVPLIYIQNRQLIDDQINNASTIINQQASQVRDLAAQHTGRAGEVAKTTMSQYSAKAQDLIGQAKSKTTGAVSSDAAAPASASNSIKKDDISANIKKDNSSIVGSKEGVLADVKKDDFPAAPRDSLPTISSGPKESFPAVPSAGPGESFPIASSAPGDSFPTVPTAKPIKKTEVPSDPIPQNTFAQ